MNRAGQKEQPYGRSPRVGPCGSGELPPSNELGPAHLAPADLQSSQHCETSYVCVVMRRWVKRGAAMTDLLPAVDTFVAHHVTVLSERLPTDPTHVLSLAGVHTVVVHQVTGVVYELVVYELKTRKYAD